MEILNGKDLSKTILSYFYRDTKDIKVVFIQVGDNQASNLYVKNKIKACDECGIESIKIGLESETTTTENLKSLIESLNKDKSVNGIMVQLPLPKHIEERVIKNSILPIKDIDGFSNENLGNSLIGISNAIIPATPQGITLLIDKYDIDLKGKHVVVLGRSETVGRPIANILSNNKYNATVTMCNSYTKDVEKYTKSADMIICAIGKARFLTKDMVSEGVDIIDVGINRDENGKLCGDCDESVHEVARYITPVPGGVGPMTVASLMYNIIRCANMQLSKKIFICT